MRNGKPIDRVEVPADVDEETAKQVALASNGAKRVLNGDQPKRLIYIPSRGGQEPKVNIVL